MKILSMVPVQHYTFEDKFKYISGLLRKHSPDMLVTPQEYFGGAVIRLHQLSFTQDELLPKLSRLANKYKCGLIVGVVEKIGKINKEAIWFIDRDGSLKGTLYKFALPKYDHVLTKGYGDIVPELDFENRFRTFSICDINVTGFFCWEVYSNILWSGLSLCKPDIVFSMIKFGVNAWPVVKKNEKTGKKDVVDFGYGTWSENGGWIERLLMANKWQVKCPIVCSTNSWNIRPISMPLCGTISLIDGQAEHTFWHPAKEDKLKEIPEKIIVDEIDVNKVRYALKNKFEYKDMVGEFPPYSLGKFTMMMKINRLEDRLLTGKESKKVEKHLNKIKNSPEELFQ